MVFFMKNNLNPKVEKILLGFASGVMIAASIWSLLIPAINMAEKQEKIAWIPAVVGFILGIAFLLIIDTLVPHLEGGKRKGIKTKLNKTTMLVLAVTLHNIPEGMAIGVVWASVLTGNAGVTVAAAFALAIGIAIQNFPEGAIISMPLKSGGMSKKRAFLYGIISGIVEPIAGVLGALLVLKIQFLLPFLLAFAAGAEDPTTGALTAGTRDKSGNLSPANSITIGKDDIDGNPGQDTTGNGNEATPIDVGNPGWVETVGSSSIIYTLSTSRSRYSYCFIPKQKINIIMHVQ